MRALITKYDAVHPEEDPKYPLESENTKLSREYKTNKTMKRYCLGKLPIGHYFVEIFNNWTGDYENADVKFTYVQDGIAWED